MYAFCNKSNCIDTVKEKSGKRRLIHAGYIKYIITYIHRHNQNICRLCIISKDSEAKRIELTEGRPNTLLGKSFYEAQMYLI